MPELTSRFNRFSLRSLLVAVAAIAIFTAWFRPYQIDERWNDHSTIHMQYKLRRDVYGRAVHVGPTNLFDTKSDSIIAVAKTDGLLHDSISDWWVGDRIYEYRRFDGTKLHWVEWVFTHGGEFSGLHRIDTGG